MKQRATSCLARRPTIMAALACATVLAWAALSPAAAFAGAVRATAAMHPVQAGLRPRAQVEPAGSLLPGTRPLGALPSGQTIGLSVVLRSRNAKGLAQFAAAVSDPHNPGFRGFLTARQVTARFGAPARSIRDTSAWLRAAGLSVSKVLGDGLVIPVRGSVAAISAAFGTRLDALQLRDGLRGYRNVSPASVPGRLAGAVQAVLGLTVDTPLPAPPAAHLARLRAAARARPVLATVPCTAAKQTATATGANLPAAMKNHYSFPAGGDTGTGVTVALYEQAAYVSTDISTFQTCLGTHAKVSSEAVTGWTGATLGPATTEATWDIETVAAFTPNASVLVYEAVDNGGLLNPAEVEAGYGQIVSDNKAQVVSTSYGECEQDAGSSFINAEASLFQEMAAQGQSMLAASGDTGSEACVQAGGGNQLAVQDPASQPFVTGVGGTDLLASSGQETAWNDRLSNPPGVGAGGGGESSVWPTPSWQQPYATSADREVPDVSASASPYHGYVGYCTPAPPDCPSNQPVSGWSSVGGTSLAAPLWAAIIARSDDAPKAHRTGLLNPSLYTMQSAGYVPTTDITSLNNDWTGTNNNQYPATGGFDMATGLGSPSALQLIQTLRDFGVRLRPVISSSGGAVQVGNTASWTVQVFNTGSVTSTGTVSLSLGTSPGGQLSVSGTGWSCSGGLCTVKTGVKPGASLPPLTVLMTNVPLAAGQAGELSLDASLNDSSNGGGGFNISSSDELPVVFPQVPHLQSTVLANGAPFVVGSPASWTVQVANTGLARSTGVITVNLSPSPSSYTLQLNATGSGWACSGNLSCATNAQLSPGGTLPPLSVTSSALPPDAGLSGDAGLSAQINDTVNGGIDPSSGTIQDAPVVFGSTPHLQMTVNASGAPFKVGGTAAWVVNVANTGTAAATGVITVTPTVTDANGDVLSWSGSGTGWTCTFQDCVTSTDPGPGQSLPPLDLTTATLTSANIDWVSASLVIDDTQNGGVDAASSVEQTSAVSGGTAGPDLVDAISANSSPVPAGGKITDTITVSNVGGAASSGTTTVNVASPFPATSLTGSGWTCSKVLRKCTSTAAIGAGSSLPNIVLTSKVPTQNDGWLGSGSFADARVTNKSDGNTSDNYTDISTAVQQPPVDLAVSENGNSGPVAPGGTITDTISVSNAGTAASKGTITVGLGEAYGLASASGTGWTCSPSPAQCVTSAAVAPGATLPPITATSTVPSQDDAWLGESSGSSASLTNTSDGNTANNFTDAETPVTQPQVDLVVGGTGTATPVPEGGTITDTLTVSNAGTQASSGNITVTISGPFSGTATGSGWTCSGPNGTCVTSATVAPGASLPPITLTYNVPAGAFDIEASTVADLSNASDGNTANNEVILMTFTK